jgi:hypothetical protein
MTTIGQLISGLYDQYLQRYHDEELAAVATEVTIDDLIRLRQRRTKRVTPAATVPA